MRDIQLQRRLLEWMREMERDSPVFDGKVPREYLLQRMGREFGDSPDSHDRYMEAATELRDEGLVHAPGREFTILSLTDKGRRAARGR